MRNDFTHACVDLAIQALPLFVVHGRGRQRSELNLGPTVFGNASITLHTPVALTHHDQSVFLGLHALAALRPAEIAHEDIEAALTVFS